MPFLKDPGPAYFARYDKSDFKVTKDRQYLNLVTGDTVSRRQYDVHKGALAQIGVGSYEQKVKALAAKRGASAAEAKLPARGRSTAKGPGAFKKASPLVNRQSREIEIPFHLWRGPDPATFILDAERFRPGFNAAVKGIRSNPKIAAAGIRAEWHNPGTGGHGWFTFLRTHKVDTDEAENSFEPSYDEMIDFFYTGSNSNTIGAEIHPLIFHVVFRDEFIPHAKVKPLLTKRKRAKAKPKPPVPATKKRAKRRLIR